MRTVCVLASVLVALGASAAGAQSASPAPGSGVKIDYDQHVKPILTAKCFACHGAKQQQSGLRLDRRQLALRGGDYGPVIITRQQQRKQTDRSASSAPRLECRCRRPVRLKTTKSPCFERGSIRVPTCRAAPISRWWRRLPRIRRVQIFLSTRSRVRRPRLRRHAVHGQDARTCSRCVGLHDVDARGIRRDNRDDDVAHRRRRRRQREQRS